MRIQLLSDLHFEFHRDHGASLVADCVAPDVDVLVLAGDIAVADGIEPALTMFSEHYSHVVYVHGNHEFYGSTRAAVVEATRRACARLGNVYWLDCDVATICGQKEGRKRDGFHNLTFHAEVAQHRHRSADSVVMSRPVSPSQSVVGVRRRQRATLAA